jgi:hypothetical protein
VRRYHEQVEPDPRIRPALFAAPDRLRNDSWRGTGFSYLAAHSGAVPDLTMLFPAPCFYASRLPGGERFRAIGDQIVAAGAPSALVVAPYWTQRNQSTYPSLRGFAPRGA